MKTSDVLGGVGDGTVRAAEGAHESRWLEGLARGGLVAYGLVYLVLAWVVLQLAFGGSQQDADASGALRTLPEQPFGRILLWLVTAGMAALSAWQGVEAAVGHRGRSSDRGRQRLRSAARAVVYAALSVSAGRIAAGAGSSATSTQQEATSSALSLPGGQVIVSLSGAAVVAVGLVQIWKAVTKSFLEEFDTSQIGPAARSAITKIGQLGYAAKGVALALVGGFVLFAALTYEPEKSKGLDGALQGLQGRPFGQFMLAAIASGFAAFGVFSILQSRYRPM